MTDKEKSELQKEIVDGLPLCPHGRLILAPRVGKSKIAIDIIKKEKPKSILWVTPSAELAEIDEPITQTYYMGKKRIDEVLPKYSLLGTHCGRRTFICNALSLGIPPQVVMKWTGHSDYSAMKPYIDIADEIKATAMEKFDLII